MKRPQFNHTSPLPRFLLGVLVAMPLCMAIWWFGLRDYLLLILQQLSTLICRAVLSEHILGIVTQSDARTGNPVWILKTSLSPLSDPRQLLAIPLSTNRFTVCFPLFWGLILATPGINKQRQLIVGTLTLIPVAVCIALLLIQFFIALNINHQAILTATPQGGYVLALPYSDLVYYLTAVGRQIAVLVLPTLGPLMLWGLFNRSFIRTVVFEGLLTRTVAMPDAHH